MRHIYWDDVREDLGGMLIILVFVFMIGRGIYVTHQARNISCPKGQSVTIDYFAVPFVQEALSCSSP